MISKLSGLIDVKCVVEIFFMCLVCSGNRVGVEGARALGDALEANTTLTKLRLDSMFLTVFDDIIGFTET